MGVRIEPQRTPVFKVPTEEETAIRDVHEKLGVGSVPKVTESSKTWELDQGF